MAKNLHQLPTARPATGFRVLRQLALQRSLLVAMEIMHEDVGNVFQITLPSFSPAVIVGPEWNRFVLVSDRDKFLWRIENDPVTGLLGHGLLVEDGRGRDGVQTHPVSVRAGGHELREPPREPQIPETAPGPHR